MLRHVLVPLTTIVCLSCAIQQSKKVEKLYLEKETIDDLAKSASGYMYRSDGRSPATYVDLGGHPPANNKYGLVRHPQASSPKRHAPPRRRSEYSRVAPTQRYYYRNPAAPIKYPPPVAAQEHVQTPVYATAVQGPEVQYSKPESYSGNYIGPIGAPIHQAPIISPLVPIVPQPLIEGSELFEKDKHYEKGGGQKHDQEYYSKHGEKGGQGYDSKHAYDKGEKGHHGAAEHKSHYDTNAGRKAAMDDSLKYYSAGDRAAQAHKGANYHHSNGHKKGSKTEGFHNVYHKDEYKKDHTFYDESDTKGHHEKYGNENAHHSAAAGATKKGGHADSGYHEDHHGEKGHAEKGHFEKDAQGHQGAQGEEQYHKENEKYDKEAGQKSGSEFGYSEQDGEKGYYS